MLRQQLIHEVRKEYERIVDSIQSPQNLPLPLANEAIHWPHKNVLCFPIFASRELCEPFLSDHDILQSPSCLSESDQEREGLHSPLNTADIQTSTPKQYPQLTNTNDTPTSSSTDSALHQANDGEQGVEQFDESSLNCLIEPLPRDREALLELRSQIVMELLWIKQAIASRQEVS